MKYIRTKDGCITEGNFEIGKTITTLYGDEPITKENTADTIEELCDEIIFILEGSPIPYSAPYQYDKERKTEWFKTETEIDIGFGFTEKIKEMFLAIWTKGEHGKPILKPVAKMNDKGELELL